MKKTMKLFGLITCMVIIASFMTLGCNDDETPSTELTAEEKATAFRTAQSAILGKTVNSVLRADETALTAAINAFNALDSDVKALLSTENTRLTSLKALFDDVNGFLDEHAEILGKTVDTVVFEDKDIMLAALDEFATLSDNAKRLLSAEETLLGQLEIKIDELEPPPPYETLAAAFRANADVTSALGRNLTTVASGNAAAISAALAEYNLLVPEVQALVTAEKHALDLLEAKLKANGWEEVLKVMYPGAKVLNRNNFWLHNGSAHYAGIDTEITNVANNNGSPPATYGGNVVRFNGNMQSPDINGGNATVRATPNIRYQIRSADISDADLLTYESILVVTTITGHTGNPGLHTLLTFRDTQDGMSDAENPVRFSPNAGAGWPGGDPGTFFLGISGADYNTFVTRNTGRGDGSRGFNIQNQHDNNDRSAAYTLTIEAVVMIPKRSTEVMNGYGEKGNEYILDPTLTTRSRFWTTPSESVPVFDWMCLSTDHHSRLNLGSLGITDAVAAGYTKLVIDYTLLYTNRPAENQFLALFYNDHGRNTANQIARSAAINRVNIITTPLEIALTGNSLAVSNMLEFVCVDGGRVVYKVNSMKLVK